LPQVFEIVPYTLTARTPWGVPAFQKPLTSKEFSPLADLRGGMSTEQNAVTG